MAPCFVDRVVIHARAGSGGHGCASVHREKFKPLGGPDGATAGGAAASSWWWTRRCTPLLDFHFHPHVNAPNGKQGAGSNRDGAAGTDLELKVPDGTVVPTRMAACWPIWWGGHPFRSCRRRPR